MTGFTETCKQKVYRTVTAGVQAAAKKHEEKQMKNREMEETKHKIQERKKTERDEMAARHLQREKHKVTVVGCTGLDKQKFSA